MILKNKILLAQVPLGILLVLMGVLYVFFIERIQDSSSEILTADYRSTDALKKMRRSLEDLDKVTWQLISRDYKSKGEILYRIKNHKMEFEQQVNIQSDNKALIGQFDQAKKLKDDWNSYINALESYVLTALKKAETSDAIYVQNVRGKYIKLRDGINTLADLNDGDLFLRGEGLSEMVNEITKSVISLTIAIFFIGVLLTSYLTNRIMEPLANLSSLIKQITDGKLGARVVVSGDDEVAQLGREFNEMAQSLEEYKNSSIGEMFRTKEYMQNALDSIPDPIIIVNGSNETLSINKAAYKEFSNSKNKDMEVEVNFLNKLPYNLKERVKLITQQVFSAGAVDKALLNPLIVNYNHKIAEFCPISRPIKEDDGEVVANVIMLRNISNIDVRGYIKAEKFVSMTHELMLPLNSIHLSIHTCLERVIGDINSKQEEFLAAARNECFAIKKMITNMQDLEKIDDIGNDVEKIELPLSEVIKESVESLSVIAASRKVAIDLDFAILSDNIMGNKDQLKLVFNNILENAINHTTDGEVVNVRTTDKADKISCLIHNRGSYIPAEFQDKVFDKFFKVPNAENQRDGLGLYIAKRIVQQHNGEIGIRSTKKFGTTFWINFPKV